MTTIYIIMSAKKYQSNFSNVLLLSYKQMPQILAKMMVLPTKKELQKFQNIDNVMA